jgi:hypothetical protein
MTGDLYAPRRDARPLAIVSAAAAMVLAAIGVLTAQTARIIPVARDGYVLVSFEVSDAFDPQVKAAIDSGLTTSFAYEVELRRGATLWVDRTIDVARVVAAVKFDNLTRQYQLSLTRDGRVERSWMTADATEVRKAITTFSRLPLFSTRKLEPNAEYYIRVKVRTRPHNALFFLPWDGDGVLGSATFTFLPR